MAAGVSGKVLDWNTILDEVDAESAPKKRGPYKKKQG